MQTKPDYKIILGELFFNLTSNRGRCLRSDLTQGLEFTANHIINTAAMLKDVGFVH